MARSKPRVKVPKTALKGEVIEIKTLISHRMESGQRRDDDGNKIPRKIINRFEARYNGVMVSGADWHGSIAANPFIAFHTLATESGSIEFTWIDDDGSVYTASAPITVT